VKTYIASGTGGVSAVTGSNVFLIERAVVTATLPFIQPADTGGSAARSLQTAGGDPLDDDNLRRRIFEKALTKAKLRHIRLHDLRHTFVSHLIQNGESLAYVRDHPGSKN
jgi:site-specific recombinase XerC